MTSRFYKNLFTFFNLICIISINFDGKKFTAPKSLRLKSIVVMGFVLVLRGILKYFEELQEVEERKSERRKVSLFFLLFVPAVKGTITLSPFVCVFILLIQQKRITDIFNK